MALGVLGLKSAFEANYLVPKVQIVRKVGLRDGLVPRSFHLLRTSSFTQSLANPTNPFTFHLFFFCFRSEIDCVVLLCLLESGIIIPYSTSAGRLPLPQAPQKELARCSSLSVLAGLKVTKNALSSSHPKKTSSAEVLTTTTPSLSTGPDHPGRGDQQPAYRSPRSAASLGQTSARGSVRRRL